MEDFLVFKIEKKDTHTIITNNSKFNLWVSLIPIKPKRKYVDIRVVGPGHFVIYEDEMDMTSLSFSLKSINPNEGQYESHCSR